MLLFLFSCVMPMLDTSDSTVLNDSTESVLEVKKVDRAITSSVKLVIKGKEGSGHASGNYFHHGKRKFIITAAHVVDSGELWIEDGIDIVKAEVLWVDKARDIAFIRPMGNLVHTKSVKFKVNYDDYKVGTIVRYAGYPSELGKMVLQGMVAKQKSAYLVLQSFALPGSSGSVIFDEKGRAMGVLSSVSIQINPWVGIPELAENIVNAGRLDFLDRKLLKEILDAKPHKTIIKIEESSGGE